MKTNWSVAVYSQERKVVKITNFNADTAKVRLLLFSPITVDAYYIVPTSRELQIDVTDIVRLAETGQFSIYGQDTIGNTVSGESVTCQWITKGLINQDTDIRPMSELLERWTEIADNKGVEVGVSVAPPSRILEQVTGFPLIIEMHGTADIAVFPIGVTSQNMFDVLNSQITIPYEKNDWFIGNDSEQITYGVYGTTERNVCNRACVVRWVSRYGVQKQFVWYYKDLRVNVSEVVSIATIDGTYDERKGYVQGLTLFLEELNAYDYWYYSDIITSSKVEICMEGSSLWRVVQVDAKNVQIPNNDMGKPKDLEVQINLQAYDAI